MQKPKKIRPALLFLILAAASIYIAMSTVFTWALPAVLISSRSNILVVVGVAIPVIWLIGSGCVALHLLRTIRKFTDTTTEKHQ